MFPVRWRTARARISRACVRERKGSHLLKARMPASLFGPTVALCCTPWAIAAKSSGH
jgi:hypothetical protein